MKRFILLLAILFAAAAAASPCYADVRVNVKGDKPTVLELFRAYAGWRAGDSEPDYELSKKLTNDAYNYIWLNKPAYVDGAKLFDKKVVDAANGYVSYEGGERPGPKMECCFWNTADRKNIIFAVNFTNEDPGSANTARMDFFLYSNASKTMKKIDPPFNILYGSQQWNDRFASTGGRNVAFRLPQKGKDIKAETKGYNEQGKKNDRTDTFKWNGRGFDVK